MTFALSLLVAIVWGSVPWSWLVAKLWRGIDLREEGSKNVGATNVLRTCGKVPGVLAYVLDGAKGFVGVYFLPQLFPVSWLDPTLYGCALMVAVMLGHIFTPFLGFRGGKGAMAGVGAAAALDPWIGLVTLGLFLIVAFATRIVSVATISASVAYPVVITVFGLAGGGMNWVLLGFGVPAAALVIFMHRGNLKRLREGRENAPLPGENSPKP
ncbi:MAG: glycerol-3-phosphate acyltransferase [bacterium]|nr:glycerol-3-phosphate acyltransferase [bacterium]